MKSIIHYKRAHTRTYTQEENFPRARERSVAATENTRTKASDHRGDYLFFFFFFFPSPLNFFPDAVFVNARANNYVINFPLPGIVYIRNLSVFRTSPTTEWGPRARLRTKPFTSPFYRPKMPVSESQNYRFS